MKVKVLSPLTHEGKGCEEGDVIDVSDTTAQHLIDNGFAEAVAAQGRPQQKEGENNETDR